MECRLTFEVLDSAGSLVLGSRRPGLSAKEGLSAWGRRTWLGNLAGDGVRLRGSETATWQGAYNPPSWVWGSGVSGVFPALAQLPPCRGSLFGHGAGSPGRLDRSRLRGVALGRPRAGLSSSRGRGSGSAQNSEVPPNLHSV